MYCAALPERGLGVAIKIDDGATARAAEITMASVIAALLPLSAADAAFVHGLAEVPLRNWTGIEVGQLRAAEPLRRALHAARG
jgi:L-asparaginase II